MAPPGPRLPILWTDRAKADLTAIGDYIAADSPVAAARWVRRLVAAVERLAEFPWSGRRVPELQGRKDLREVVQGAYRIVYRVKRDAVVVLTVFEGHRRFPDELSEDEGGPRTDPDKERGP
ncbi:type II toxin-antitoxin system RelE/ParE family toxin [Deferrisoma sp.]